MRKFLAIILALVMALGLVACSNADSKTTSSEKTSSEKTSSEKTSSGTSSAEEADTPSTQASSDVYEVKMVMPYILTAPGEEAVQKTEDTINDYLLNTLGVTEYRLDLTVISYADSKTIVPMDLAAQEKLDIISVGSSVSTFVSNGYLLPLDDYLDNELADAAAVASDFLICYYLNGHYYALPSWSGQVTDYRFIYNKEMVDAVYDMSGVDTWDEVLDAVEALKTAYPDEHFLCYANTMPAIYATEDHTNTVGSYTATVGSDTALVNYYATDAYRKGCEKAYELRQKDMLDPEGSNNTMGHDALTYSGSTKGVVMNHSLTEESVVAMFDENNTYGATFDAVTFARSDMVNARFSYGIPYTSENPSMAAKFLNLIWTDEFIFNTLGFGTENVDYVKTDVEGIIEYPEGLKQMTVAYNCIYALAGIGDQRMIWEAPGGTSRTDIEFINEEMTNCFYPPAYGFTPVTDNVANQIAAVSNVVSQYNTALIYGEADPDEFLPEFLQELESAGINDIISEYQSQFDAWSAGE